MRDLSAWQRDDLELRSFADRVQRALLTAGIDRHELHHETATNLPVDFHSGRAEVDARTAMQLSGCENTRYVVDEPLKMPADALLPR